MKKILFIITLLMLSLTTYAIEEDTIILDEKQELFQKDVEDYSPYSKEALKAIINKEYDLNSTKGIFDRQLKLNFDDGFISEIGTSFKSRFMFCENISNNDSDFNFKPHILDIGFQGKFKGDKEAFNTLFEVSQSDSNFFHKLVLDAWIETKRIPNNTLMIGTSRTPVGIEGGKSAFLTPFMIRTQTARHFANIRKTGIRLKGNYKYVDYDIGGYSSDTWYTSFFPGVESDLWVQFKPLANVNEKLGSLMLGGGYAVGCRDENNFQTASSALSYDYKKFSAIAEYQYSNGSNGLDGLIDKKRDGYNITAMYKLTKKIEFLLRYDSFNPDKEIHNNNSREYSAGINYYLLGQGLRLILNYVFCQNQNTDNSHKIIFGAQVLI